MQLGMVGLGRMGAQMVRRLLLAGHKCVVYDRKPEARRAAEKEGAIAVSSLDGFASGLTAPRAVWLMVPAAVVPSMIEGLLPALEAGDAIIDGGNSFYRDDIRRATELAGHGLSYVDVGTSGGVWGAERGYCLMIGGEPDVVKRLQPIFAALAPGVGTTPRTPGREQKASTAEQGFLHCGPSGAGHFVKMVHNGIEYGLMAAYAEGFNILAHANVGSQPREADSETAPLRHPEFFRFDFDLSEIAELWRRGSVVSSWLLDLTAQELLENPTLDRFSGRVSDSGEGRWTVEAAVEEGVPSAILSTALSERFASRGRDDVAEKLLSAMRYGFGGHEEKR